MIKVSIFSFPIFGEFNKLLANSVLLPAYIDVGSNYFPRLYMQQVITCRIYKRGKQLIPAFIYVASNYLLRI